MSHYAKIENNIVTNVIVADKDFIDSGAIGDPSTWIEVQDSNGINIHCAGIGFTYDALLTTFIPPKPFDSWILVDLVWVAPVDKPQGTDHYVWDELTVSWIPSPLVILGE
jgi:hypothetical protein